MLFFAIVYVVEGIGQGRVGIVFQPINHYLKEIGWTPFDVTAYLAILNFPWVIKPLYGLVSDFVPLFGFRRKSYLIVASLLAAAAYAVIATLNEPGEFALLLVLTSYAMATASTLCGALLAENGRRFGLSGAFVNQQLAASSSRIWPLLADFKLPPELPRSPRWRCCWPRCSCSTKKRPRSIGTKCCAR
jgi:BT1 family